MDRRRPIDDDVDDAADDANVPTGPALLSQTGLYSDFGARTISPELIPFAPRFEFWADGASKGRWLYLPPGTKIQTSSMDHWTFPVGTKAFKEFRYQGKLVETRLLMKVREGRGNNSWWEVAYVWKEDGSDAVASPAGVVDALGTNHKVPKQTDCFNCHGGVSDVLLGVSAIQLADASKSTLADLAAAGRLSDPVPTSIEVPGTGAAKDALAYLHANCGHCHNDDAPRISTQTPLRLRLLVGQTAPEQTGAFTTTAGTVMKHPLVEDGGMVTDIVVKGSPEQSGLWVRMGRRDDNAMPPAGTQLVDDVGREKIRAWIAGWQ